MAFDQRLITVAIHTCEHALALKEKLERADIYVTLQNINLEHPVVASGMRVRIKESDLAKALLLIEGDESHSGNDEISQSLMPEVLVPVDFSPYSVEAAVVAYHIAALLKANVTLLNTFYSPIQAASTQLSAALTYDKPVPDTSADALEVANRQMLLLQQTVNRRVNQTVNSSVNQSVNHKVKTKVHIGRGLPEDVINSYSKEHSPLLIVMGTRGADKKGKDSIGSVTAEVLDTCRRPVLTIPEGITADDIKNISRVLYFCTGEQSDILAIQRLHELMGSHFNEIALGSLQSKRASVGSSTIEALKRYCTEHFQETEFSVTDIPLPSSSEGPAIKSTDKVELIAIPNKRKSAFSRLFNPGIAHRLLFRADIPMLVIPV